LHKARARDQIVAGLVSRGHPAQQQAETVEFDRRIGCSRVQPTLDHRKIIPPDGGASPKSAGSTWLWVIIVRAPLFFYGLQFGLAWRKRRVNRCKFV
jgi:hypothetical protein